ncbi:MAG: 2-hydroxymuconate tautomerase family protein [Cupriavidus sp.]|nr:2-hydroxymuconate tautomerase family protein [Cupriavidus sp.]NUT16657.1 2-hydroxymuconate tautomerase family protein [Cupriavidus sp.]
MPVIQVYMIAGRTPEQKAAFITQVTDAAVSALGVEPSSVRVMCLDVPKTDYAIGGHTASALGR